MTPDSNELLARVEAGAKEDALRQALVEADGCFEAALFEGWIDALENGDIERLRDLWYRRMAYGLVAVRSGLVCSAAEASDNEIQSSDRGVESQTRKELSADPQSLIAAGNVDSLGVAPGRSEAIPSDDVRSAPADLPVGIWADRIERTTRLVKVRDADSYGSAMYAAHIDCFYDFEVKRLVSLLRTLAALRSAPVSGPATTRAVLKQNDDRPLPSYGQIPWVQLGRDVMDAMYAKRADYEFDPTYYPGHQMLPQLNFNSLARIVDKYRWHGIDRRSPIPDATVSEPVAWRWQHVNDRREPRPWHYEDAPWHGNEYMQAEPLYTSPQHVDREATVSARAVTEPCGHRDCEFPNCDCETPVPASTPVRSS